MLARISTRLVLFLSSYAPLFLILGVRTSVENLALAVFFYALAVLSVTALVLFINTAKNYSPHNVVVARVESRGAELTSYIVTYLLPFVAVSLNDLATTVSLAILLGVIAIVYVQSNLIHINPLLNILGYHLFEAEIEGGKSTALISRNAYVRGGSTIEVVSLGDYIVMEVKS